jgi:uncharacterized protein
LTGALGLGSLVLTLSWSLAQTKTRLSIATGGTGGVYYPYEGGMAAVLSRHLPGVEATAEVPAASVDNCTLVAVHKEANHLTIENAVEGSPLPFHPGAIKFFEEKGAKL